MDPYTDSNFVNFNIISFNTRGFDLAKQRFCYNLLNYEKVHDNNEIKILCNQENFILRGNKHLLKEALPGFYVIFKPAVKDNIEGRPKNGMFIAIPEKIKSSVIDVSPLNWRLQAVILRTANKRLLLINSYFPQDPRTIDFRSNDLEDILADIKKILDDNEYNDVLLMGDINADFSRHTGFVKRTESFVKEQNMKFSWNKFEVEFTHEYTKDDKTYISKIDHFFWNQDFETMVTAAGVIHDVENTSDHHPISCKLKYNNVISDHQPPIQYNSKPSWKFASETERNKFTTDLQKKMEEMTVPDCLSCSDPHCKNCNHINTTDEFMLEMLQVVENCASTNLPKPKQNRKRSKGSILAWSEEVQPFKEDAQFWHQVWISAGKPLITQLHLIMKRTRNIYHYQIRKCKQAALKIKKNTLLDSCINNNGDIFVELKKLRNKDPDRTTVIDGKDANISNHFADIYNNLYNSTDDQEDVEELLGRINEIIDSKSIEDVHKITPDVVEKAVSQIKSGKSDPVNTFSSDCIKRAPKRFFEYLALIFRSYLIHGHISQVLMLSTLVPLLKDKLGDHCSSSNYRSIALSSLILKIFDWVLILICEKKTEIR